MQKCYACSKQYPETAMSKMVHVIERKAYIKCICPACQSIVANNPTYYYLVEEKETTTGSK
ncbi:MAG TPA: hypothetical protein VN426_11040 [Syntrophomonadaceae bacterium]|nr:hypothetical protein [Syntrophomonadaceae bacterium]